MAEITLGIIGIGGFGQAHAEALARNAHCEIGCVWSRTEARAARQAERFGCAHVADYRGILDRADINAVVIAVPNALHYALAVEALRAGKHVIIEYPAAQTVEEFDRLCEEADLAQLVLHHALTPVIEPQPLAVHEMLELVGHPLVTRSTYYGGGIGSWYVDPQQRGNFFAAFTIHMICYWLIVLEEKPDWIDATIHVHQRGEAEQHIGTCLCHFPDGTVAWNDWGMGFRTPVWEWSLEGDNGRLIYERPADGAHRVRAVTAEDRTLRELAPQHEALDRDVTSFVDQVLLQAEPYCTREMTRQVLGICEAALHSAESGRRVGTMW